MDDRYFSRAATWSRLENSLVVHDSYSPKAPRMVTMEPWHEMVFMAADGVHTVGQFVEHMGAQYDGGIPDGLREQIHEIVTVLVGEHIIRVHADPQPLPPYFAEEYFEADAEKRKKQMQDDGLID